MNKRKNVILLSVILFTVLLIICIGSNSHAGKGYEEEEKEVTKIIDGDTIIVKDIGNVRLIGVDCPEEGELGYMTSKRFTESAVKGKKVIVQICKVRKKDDYGRTRAIVYYYLGLQPYCLNIELIRKGLGKVFPWGKCHISLYNWFVYENNAKKERIGIWSGRNIP